MSLGSIIGGVVGGVVGFFVGGPSGAYYGAAIGFGIGMAIDPITPDIPTPGIPNPEEQVMNGEIGGPIYHLCGTAKVPGKLLAFGKERNEKVYSESSGGGGKGGPSEPEPQVTGYKYYMSWVLGLVACPDNPVDTLYAIYKNDDKEAVWSGELDLPVSGGQETIAIEGIGSCTFYFGTDDQVANSSVGEIITDSTLNTPYRYLCWAFMDDCYIGEYNRTPTYKFLMKKIPKIDAMPDYGEVQTYDCNPAHAIYYIFNTLSGLPTSWLDSDSFNDVALTLTLESRGISILLDSQQSALNYIEAINGHVDNIVRYGSDGKFHLKLIRDDYDVDDLLLVDEDVMLDDPNFNRGSWIDTINESKVQYNELYDVIRAPSPTALPDGEWVAALEQRDTDYIYFYDIDNYAVIKVNTSETNPIVVDYLVINNASYDLDYGRGYGGNTSGQRGSYCMSKDYNKIWYLFRDNANGNLKLVEVNITSFPMTITKTSLHSAIVPGEQFEDACGDDDYAFFPTSKISGRILRFDTDHTLVDKEFNYTATGGQDESIHSIDINTSLNELVWVYTRDTPFRTAYYPYSSFNFIIRTTHSRTEGGSDPAQWQQFIRYDVKYPYLLTQRCFNPLNGIAWTFSYWEVYTDGYMFIQNLQFMQNFLGGNLPYYYILRLASSANSWSLHRFERTDTTIAQVAVPQISVDVTSYIDRFTNYSAVSVYNEENDKSFLCIYNSSDGKNYLASFDSSLSLVSDFAPFEINWGL